MYDINTKFVKKGRTFHLIFIIAGLFFLLVFGSIYIKSLDSNVMSTKVVFYKCL